MFRDRYRRGPGLYDSQSMSHPAHGGLTPWQRNMIGRPVRPVRYARQAMNDASRDPAGSGMDGASRAAPAEPDRGAREGEKPLRHWRRPRDIWEEQARFGARQGDRGDGAANPFA